MKVAAASAEDLEALNNLCIELEDCFPKWGFQAEDEKILEVVKEFWPKAASAYTRVILGYGVMFDNACDSNADSLEWKPEIAELLHAAEKRYAGEPNPHRIAT